MSKNINFETYLTINSKYFLISVVQKLNNNLVYEDKKMINDVSKKIDLNLLDDFLKKNVFEIEKKIGNFLNNIFLIIDYSFFFHL